MSDLSPELPRPVPPRTWREHLADVAEALDLGPRRLAVGSLVLAGLGVIGWRLLAPAPTPAEMRLPFAQADGRPSASGGEGGSTGGSVGGASATAVGAAGGTGASAPTEVVVHVAGAVAKPGVQHLAPGSRVIDAVEAAGGARPDADLARVNLAALLVDGQQVYVPKPGEPLPTVAGAPGASGVTPTSGGGASGATPGAPGPLVNLNTATADELDTLPGVGPTTAAAIIAYRDEHGPFTTVDQLLDVRGIGDAKLAQLQDLVTV